MESACGEPFSCGRRKSVPGDALLAKMMPGRHLTTRQSQAEARIRRQDAASKDEANRIHHHVGQQVRRFIIEELEGTPPEQLPTPTESVQQVRAREQRRVEAEQQPNLWSEEP